MKTEPREYVPLDIVLTRPPGPKSDFVEAEVDGRSINIGHWHKREDGNWALRILIPACLPACGTYEGVVDDMHAAKCPNTGYVGIVR